VLAQAVKWPARHRRDRRQEPAVLAREQSVQESVEAAQQPGHRRMDHSLAEVWPALAQPVRALPVQRLPVRR